MQDLLRVAAVTVQQQERDDSNLYIANLPVHTSEKDLEMMFASFGTVVSTRILRTPHGISRGVGFVRMDSKHVCERVIDAFNNKLLPGATKLPWRFLQWQMKKALREMQTLHAGCS